MSTEKDREEKEFAPLEDEIKNLYSAVNIFSLAMKAKLRRKAREGFRGWSDTEFKEMIEQKLKEHVERQLNGEGQEVDIANLAMMLHFQRTFS